MYPVKKEALCKITYNRNQNLSLQSYSLFHSGKCCNELPAKFMCTEDTEAWEKSLLLQKCFGMYLRKPNHSFPPPNTNIVEKTAMQKENGKETLQVLFLLVKHGKITAIESEWIGRILCDFIFKCHNTIYVCVIVNTCNLNRSLIFLPLSQDNVIDCTSLISTYIWNCFKKLLSHLNKWQV